MENRLSRTFVIRYLLLDEEQKVKEGETSGEEGEGRKRRYVVWRRKLKPNRPTANPYCFRN